MAKIITFIALLLNCTPYPNIKIPPGRRDPDPWIFAIFAAAVLVYALYKNRHFMEKRVGNG